MNTDTGEIVKGAEAIAAALGRGEPVVPVSDRVAELMELGRAAAEQQAIMRVGLAAGLAAATRRASRAARRQADQDAAKKAKQARKTAKRDRKAQKRGGQ